MEQNLHMNQMHVFFFFLWKGKSKQTKEDTEKGGNI